MLKTLLLIADDDDLCEVVHILLEGLGPHIHDAHDGATGLRLAREAIPDLIILDTRMSGESMLEALRGNDDTADIPVVALVDGDAGERVLAAGVTACLDRAFDPPELVRVVAEILGT